MSTALKLEVLESLPSTQSSEHPPLVFVHGSYCGAWVWAERFMPFFSEAGYECFAVSLRGHGESESGARSIHEFGVEDYVSDVVSVIDRMKRPPVLVGHSMGGMIVQKAMEVRETAGVILLASVPPEGLSVPAMHMMLAHPDLMAQLSLGQVFGMQWVDPKLWHRFLFSPEMPWEEIKPYLPRLSQESMSAAFELMMRHCPRPRSGQFPPMLVLGGTDDAFVPELALRQTARAYEADLEILPKVPHVMMLDSTCWREVAEMLAAWLKEKKF